MIHTLLLTNNEMHYTLKEVRNGINRLLNSESTPENLAATEALMVVEMILMETLEADRFKP